MCTAGVFAPVVDSCSLLAPCLVDKGGGDEDKDKNEDENGDGAEDRDDA